MSLIDHSAPGGNAGYTYQFDRALFRLAESKAGCTVGIETDDDVAVRAADGSRVLEQAKHSIQEDGAPFGDRSKDLWNTLAIWIDAIEKGEVPQNLVRFYMVTNKTLEDCIARAIGAATTADAAAACISSLQSAAVNPPKSIAGMCERVLAPNSRKTLEFVILNCELVDAASCSSGKALRKEIIAHLQLPDWCTTIADSVCDELAGWIQKTVLAKWQAHQPAWIQRDHFVNQMHAIIDLRKRQIRRERAEHLIPIAEDSVGHHKGSTFVKQLHLISDDDSLVDEAIRDFLRCSVEKARLSAEGNVTDDDWLTFQSALIRRWVAIRRLVARTFPNEPEEINGFKVFSDTATDHREKLAGVETDQVYLTAGSYHLLANALTVGWHPRFEELLNPKQA
jgi:hypothetical protein